MIKNICISFLIGIICWSCTNCEYQIKSYLDPLSFKGIVSEKYIDYENHKYPRVIIDEGGKEKLFVPYESFNGKSFYDYIELGDSILKDQNSRTVYVKRNEELKEFVFKCME